MAAKKNTAQAYEVLYRIAKEKRLEKQAVKEPQSGGASTPAEVPPPAPARPPQLSPRVDRAPLLKPDTDVAVERPRRRIRRGESPPAVVPLASASRGRGGPRSLLSQLDAARGRARELEEAGEEREALLEDSMDEPRFPARPEIAPFREPPVRASVDPALLGQKEGDDWQAPSRVRCSGLERAPAEIPVAVPAGGPPDMEPEPEADASPQHCTSSESKPAEPPERHPEGSSPTEPEPPGSTGIRPGPSHPGRLKRAADWLLGDASTRLLEKRLEIKLSTLLVGAMSGIVVTTLVLTYIRLPPPEDSLLRAGVEKPQIAPVDTTGPQPPAPVRLGAVRRLPLWGPGMADEADGAAHEVPGPAPPPDVRNVVVEKAQEPAPTPPAPAPALPEPGAGPEVDGRPHHIIQVRAKESWEGANRLVEYLSLFGFEKPLLEEDARGDRTSSGEKLYTVFVGRYLDRAEAERECHRLKRETRQRPYRGRTELFQDSLVITRKR